MLGALSNFRRLSLLPAARPDIPAPMTITFFLAGIVGMVVVVGDVVFYCCSVGVCDFETLDVFEKR